MFNIQHLFQMFNQQGGNSLQIKHTRIEIPHFSVVKQEELNSFSNEIKNIYDHIFVSETDTEENKKKLLNFDNLLMFQQIETPMPICNKILNPHQAVFRCYDCMTHQASVLCKKCFQNANHKGHRYSQISSGGGNCDCGNPDAISPIGFCVDHPGKAEPVYINSNEKQHFINVFGTIFQWIFRLHEKEKSKSADSLGQVLADFLLKRNEKSLYYNTLTYDLIFGKRIFGLDATKREEKLIDKIFEYGVKLINFAKKMTDVFLNMFSLEVVKYELTVSYTQAYNRIKGFQISKFKSLYIQLFANNDILEKMLNEKKMVLYPTKSTYDYPEYIENLIFLSSIKQEVAQKFFVLLIQKGPIRFPELDKIEKDVEQNGQHIVNIINQIMNLENYYYMLMETIVGLVKNKPHSLHLLLRHYVNQIMDEKYSYNKNKVIMPFHKVLTIIMIAICQGDLRNISVQNIQKCIGSQYSLKQVFSTIFRLILSCWKQFSKTFFETSYFDNYIPLYVKSGNMIVIFDLLMFSICIQVFLKVSSEKEVNQIIFDAFKFKLPNNEKPQYKIQEIKKESSEKLRNFHSVFDNDFSDFEEQWIDEDDSRMDQEPNTNQKNTKQDQIKILKKNLELMKIMIESCISDRSQIVVANSIKIQDENLKLRTQRLFVQVMNNFKEISAQNLKLVNKNFIETKHFEDQLIKNFLTFDKVKKKYTLNQMKDERFSTSKTPFFLYPSMKKFGGIFAEEIKEPIENLISQINLSKEKVCRLKLIFNGQFINEVSKQFLDQLTNKENIDNKEVTKVFLDFLEIMKILQHLMREQAPMPIYELQEKIADLSTKEQFSFLSEKFARKHSEDLLQKEKISAKLKFEEKKKKKLEKIKKMQEAYSQVLQQKTEKNEQDESVCLICREENSQGLCFLSSFSYSNILQAFNKVEGRSLVFDSCFHSIHIKCFIQTSKQQSLPCPLCKSLSNIMLPFEKQFNDEKTIFGIYERIVTLKAVLGDDEYDGYDKKFEEFGFLSIFRALTCLICKNLLKNEPILDEKDQRIANILYGVIKAVSSHSNKKYQLRQDQYENQIKAFETFLQIARQKFEKSTYQMTNLYAVQYVALKILYSCFSQNSSACLSALKQPAANLINRNDLRKIWQMCNQIVSLPVSEWPQEVLQIKQMNSVIDLYNPPENIYELIHLRDSTQMSCKNGHQMCICIICKMKCCYDCKEIKKHFTEVHCGEGLAFNLLTGGLVYFWDKKLIQTPSLYLNQMGFEWKPSKTSEGFQLDKETYKQLKKAILNEKISKFLMQKYPDILKKGVLMDMNML